MAHVRWNTSPLTVQHGLGATLASVSVGVMVDKGTVFSKYLNVHFQTLWHLENAPVHSGAKY